MDAVGLPGVYSARIVATLEKNMSSSSASGFTPVYGPKGNKSSLVIPPQNVTADTELNTPWGDGSSTGKG